MSCLDDEKEVDKFIEKYDIIPTHRERLILKLAILHGAMAYNQWRMDQLFKDNEDFNEK